MRFLPRPRATSRALAHLAFASAAVACGGGEIDVRLPPPPVVTPPPIEAVEDAPLEEPEPEVVAQEPCPADMVYVDGTYCPRVRQPCLLEEYNRPNKITICHKFTKEQRCLGGERRQQFCIDRYEYPNEEGGHPPVMVDWYDAAGACEARGKRLCWESEWVTACEGPEKLPFPYGHSRDARQCNIDNPYLDPSLKKLYSADPEVAGRELLRIDQGAPSGAREACVSGYGVHDLTGNFDEWVNAEHPRGPAKWAGLKGGAWGHVRNACRPMTTSHPPNFTYYFVSFRCCADPTLETEDATVWRPPPPPRKPDPKRTRSEGWTPSAP